MAEEKTEPADASAALLDADEWVKQMDAEAAARRASRRGEDVAAAAEADTAGENAAASVCCRASIRAGRFDRARG